MSHKKNDSYPPKTASLNTTQLPRETSSQASGESPVVFEEQARSVQFVLFNKTSLIGVGILAIALVSVAIPYSLGWFSTPTSVAETDESSKSKLDEDPPEETDASLLFTLPLVSNSQGYTAGNVTTEPLDWHAPDMTSSDSPSLLDGFSVSAAEFGEMSAAMQVESGLIEQVEDDESLNIPDLDVDSAGTDELSLAQNQAEQLPVRQSQATDLPKLSTPQRSLATSTQPQRNNASTTPQIAQAVVANENLSDGELTPTKTPHSPLPTSHSQVKTPTIQPLVDQSAINSHTLSEMPTGRTPLRVSKVDSSPDTTHPIDENDYQGRELATFANANTSYAAQAIVEDLDDDFSSQEPLKNLTRPALLKKEYQPKYVKISQGSRALPNTAGQLWCEYDITPFTRAAGTAPGLLPEQTLVKWIRRQTGEEFWHGEPFGLLSATADTLYVYHTPEVQEMVAEIVDRFVNPKGETDAYMFRVVSLNGPNWLTQFHANLKPIRIDTAGAQGWLLAKEDYARMIPELARRSDYKELCSPQFPIKNGRQYVVSSSIPKNYKSNVLQKEDVWPGYASEMAVINEGYSMTLIPLSGVDGVSAELMVKCDSVQVEKMHSVALNVPSRITSRQRETIESPQVSHFQLDEQIRWPKEKVLVLSLGTIPVPSATQYNDAGKLIPEISRKISGSPAARGHVLLFVECKTQSF